MCIRDRATRAVEFAENSRKEYVAGLRLGLSTDTQDTTGQTLETRPVTVTPVSYTHLDVYKRQPR